MNDGYLWDRSGPPDPEVAAFERLLAPLGQPQPPVPLRIPESSPARDRTASARRTSWMILPLAAAATLAIALSPLWLRPSPHTNPAAWQVVRLEGAATISSELIAERSTLSVGEWLRTDSNGRALIDVGEVGRVEIGPATRVRLLATRAGHYRLGLARGTLSAYIWAPPGQFFVETPSSLAVDLGCAYTLQIDDWGAGVLRVTSGWVGFEWRDRQALIPAGAVCATRPGVGPGTPRYEDAPAELGAALDTLDFGRVARPERAAALDRAIAAARPRDALTLWHLLQRVDKDQRDRVYDRLAEFVPPPLEVTREGIRSGDRRMLDLWWDRLGLGSAQWWRGWSRPWTDPIGGSPSR